MNASDDAFNKPGSGLRKPDDAGVLMGNWLEERVLRESTGEGRCIPQRHLPRSGLLKDFSKVSAAFCSAMMCIHSVVSLLKEDFCLMVIMSGGEMCSRRGWQKIVSPPPRNTASSDSTSSSSSSAKFWEGPGSFDDDPDLTTTTSDKFEALKMLDKNDSSPAILGSGGSSGVWGLGQYVWVCDGVPLAGFCCVST